MSGNLKAYSTQTTTTSDNRESLRRALTKKDYDRAFTKVGTNMLLFCENIDKLQIYCLRIGSKEDNKEKSSTIDSVILSTADLFNETFNLINDIKEYDYTTKSEKINNITGATELEDKCNKYKDQYERLVQKIKAHNMNIIRQSYVFSSISSFDFNPEANTKANINSNSNSSKPKAYFSNGRDFLDDIESKQKQNETIDQAAFIISASASRKNSIQNVLFSIKGDGMNKQRGESFERKIEYNISKAFTTERQSFLSKNLLYIILTLVFIGVVLSLIYE